MDIFDNTILCNECGKAMKPSLVSKNGFNLRAVKCDKCEKIIVHPVDKQEYDEFMRLKQKDFNVKMRMVGNSYAVSIPREIVDFMKEQENIMNNMVKLCFEDAGKISMNFNLSGEGEEAPKSRVVSSKEIRIVKNGKPVLHARKFSDSAHPEKNQTKVFNSSKFDEEELEDGR